MSGQTELWRREIERRISVYEASDALGESRGRLARFDYLGLAALNVVLVVGFWLWGGV